MKDVIFMGKTGSGKTTLCQKIHNVELEYKKTQAIELYTHSIDTPGEYMENRSLYHALITTSADADIIALVYDPTQEENYIAPGFASIFSKEVIGIITKINRGSTEEKNRAENMLINAGVSKIFEVDTVDDVGIDNLLDYLE